MENPADDAAKSIANMSMDSSNLSVLPESETLSKKYAFDPISYFLFCHFSNALFHCFCFLKCSALKKQLKNKQREEERRKKEEEKAKKQVFC